MAKRGNPRLVKGVSGNPNGRPKGSENKETKALRERLAMLLDDRYAKFLKEMDTLTGMQFVTTFKDLLEYCTPKLNRTDLSNDGEKFDFSSINGADAIARINRLLDKGGKTGAE